MFGKFHSSHNNTSDNACLFVDEHLQAQDSWLDLWHCLWDGVSE